MIVQIVAVFLFLVLLIPAAQAAEGKAAWQLEWETTVTAAKKEGQLDLLASPNPLYLQDFQKAYPEIKIVDHAAGGGSQARLKVLTERRAGKYLVDVNMGGPDTPISVLYPAKAFDPIAPQLILPEVVDRRQWFEGAHHYADREGQYIFLFEGTADSYVTYNTNLVRRGEINSYWDLLNPRWKGKMAAQDPRYPATVSHALRFIYYHAELGPKFLSRLFTEMDFLFSRDNRQMLDWVASGKYAICLFCRKTEIYQAMKQGVPVELAGPYSLKEGASIVPVTGAIAVFNRAPHPNAAKLFSNWFLSRAGQIAYQKSKVDSGGADSLRIDIAKDEVPPDSRRGQGKYVMVTRPEWFDMTPIHNLIKDALGQAKAE